jgi:hypothetical protein
MTHTGAWWLFPVLLAAAAAPTAPQSTTCATLAGAIPDAAGRSVRVVADTILTDPRGGPEAWQRHGCLLSVVDTTSREGAPTDLLDSLFRMNGWKYLTEYAADGPDGTMFAFDGARELCVVRGAWDGGDDSDPTVVPAPGFTISVGCVPANSRGTAR